MSVSQVNYFSYHVKNSYGVKAQFTSLMDMLFHPSLIPFITWRCDSSKLKRNELSMAPNIGDLIRSIIPLSEITSFKETERTGARKRAARAPLSADEPYFRSGYVFVSTLFFNFCFVLPGF
jgi:hypothetical protein